MKPKNSKIVIAVLISIVLFALVMANKSMIVYTDLSSQLTSIKLNLIEGEYKSIAWLSESEIAVLYRPESLISAEMNSDFRIGVFSIATESIKDFVFNSSPEECKPKPSGIHIISRISDQKVGFIFSCYDDSVLGYLYFLDLKIDEFNEIYHYPKPFRPAQFSFSPNNLEWLQENATGGGLNNQILIYSKEGGGKQLFTDFERARSPAWSNNGYIAFAGNKQKELEGGAEFLSWSQIVSKLDAGWNIYLVNPSDAQLSELLTGVQMLAQIKWQSNNSSILAFSGRINDQDGVWLLNINTGEISLLWNEITSYDWSPDGMQLVFLDKKSELFPQLKIVDLP